MTIRQKDYILRLIEQAAAALRRLRERLASSDADVPERATAESPQAIALDARRAQHELLGEHAPLLQALDPTSAATMVRDPQRLALWVELLRTEAEALRRAGDASRAAALDTRAAALAARIDALP